MAQVATVRRPHGKRRFKTDSLRYSMAVRGLTQDELARAAGVSKWLVSRALNGHEIETPFIRKIAEALAKAPPIIEGLLEESA